MLKSGLLLISSGTGVRLIQLLRSAIIARIVSVEDFGIIATFTLTTNLMQMISDFALDRLIVQNRNGDDSDFVATLQTIQIIRGILGSILLFLLAGPYARIMGLEDLIWPYQVLALFPLLTGCINLDLYRPQRRGDFKVYARWQMISPLFSLVVLAGLLLVFDDWRIGLALTVFMQAFSCLTSHILSERRMRLAFRKEYAVEALRFGWPLMLNGIVLYAIMNGDRIVVSNRLGLEELAFFTVALGMAQIPVSVLAKAHQYIFLPELSRTREKPKEFARAVLLTLQSRMALSLGMALLLALIGPDLVTLVYGEKYAAIGVLVIWTGIYHSMRSLKGAPGTVAVSLGATSNPLLANLLRAVSLPISFLALINGADLIDVVGIAIAAEFAGYMLSLVLLRRTMGGQLPRGIVPATLATLAVLVLIGADALFYPPKTEVLQSFHWMQLLLIAATLAAVFSMATLRRWMWRQIAPRLGRG